MTGFFAGSLLILLDSAGIACAAMLAGWAANHDLPGLLKGAIGAICGALVEVIRVSLGLGLMRLLYGSSPDAGDFVAWLVNFRMFNIPLLVGFGFMAGSAAGQRTVSCPTCGKPVSLDASATRGATDTSMSIVATAEPSRVSEEICPHCHATFSINAQDLTVVGHEASAKHVR